MSDDDNSAIRPPSKQRTPLAHWWKPGQSGNPSGRPKRDKENSEILNVASPGSLRILWELAQQRDLTALQTLVRHSVPPPKASTVRIDLGPLQTASDCQAAVALVSEAVSNGEIDPTEAAPLMSMIDTAMKIYQAADLAEQVRELQRQLKESRR